LRAAGKSPTPYEILERVNLYALYINRLLLEKALFAKLSTEDGLIALIAHSLESGPFRRAEISLLLILSGNIG
jgi:hypothetical protein